MLVCPLTLQLSEYTDMRWVLPISIPEHVYVLIYCIATQRNPIIPAQLS